jgi:hypothetical protein
MEGYSDPNPQCEQNRADPNVNPADGNGQWRRPRQAGRPELRCPSDFGRREVVLPLDDLQFPLFSGVVAIAH